MNTSVPQAVETFLREAQRLPNRSTPHVRRLRRSLSRELADAPAADILDAAHLLIQRNWRWVGYELVQHHRDAMAAIRLKDVLALGAGMRAWDHVDTFACSISGPAWRTERISDAAVRRWTRSADRWWRRAALVSTVPLNVKSQGGLGDVPRTLDICARLVDDRDDMVEKGLSWALRCLVAHDPAQVEKFLQTYQDRIGARVRREVRNKVTTGLKNPRRHPG